MCKHCETRNVDNKLLKYDKNNGMSISIDGEKGTLKATNYEHTETVEVKINFCPICGKHVGAVKCQSFEEILDREG